MRGHHTGLGRRGTAQQVQRRDDAGKGRLMVIGHTLRHSAGSAAARFSTTLAMALALTFGVAAPAMAADSDAQGRCISEAIMAGLIGGDANPSNTNFVAGTEGNDNFDARATAGPDVFCGFGGRDSIHTLVPGDIFLGGEGKDAVIHQYGGTFLGGGGDEMVVWQYRGTFDGGEGDDTLHLQLGGTFTGGEGEDRVLYQYGGTFNGDADDDAVNLLYGGTFNGGEGDDVVRNHVCGCGTFNQD